MPVLCVKRLSHCSPSTGEDVLTLTVPYFLNESVRLHSLSCLLLFRSFSTVKAKSTTDINQMCRPPTSLSQLKILERHLGSLHLIYAGPQSSWHKNIFPALFCGSQVNLAFVLACNLSPPTFSLMPQVVYKVAVENTLTLISVWLTCCASWWLFQKQSTSVKSFLYFPTFLFSSSAPVFNHGLPRQRSGQA